MRGYFGIGIYGAKNSMNIGSLWRSAYIYKADFIFTIGARYKHQPSDTLKVTRHVPLYSYLDWEDFIDHLPGGCEPICIELSETSKPLHTFAHPQSCAYILGAEDTGIPARYLLGRKIVQIESPRTFCNNVATTGSLVMYDRYIKHLACTAK